MNKQQNRQKTEKPRGKSEMLPLFRAMRANQPRHRIAATLDSAESERTRCGRSRCATALARP